MKTKQIFISYAKADAYSVGTALYNTLKGTPTLKPWMDTNLEAGPWSTQIEKAIKRCDYMLVLLSADVLRDPNGTKGFSFVRREIQFAQSLPKRPRIIPLLVDKTVSPPIELQGEEYIRFYDTATREAGWQKLTQWLGLKNPPPWKWDSSLPHSPSPKRTYVWFGFIGLVGYVIGWLAYQIRNKRVLSAGIGTLGLLISFLALYPDDARRSTLETIGLLDRTPTLTMTITPTQSPPPTDIPITEPTHTPALALTQTLATPSATPTVTPTPTNSQSTAPFTGQLNLLYTSPDVLTLWTTQAVDLSELRFEWDGGNGLQTFRPRYDLHGVESLFQQLEVGQCLQFYLSEENTNVPGCNPQKFYPMFLTNSRWQFWTPPANVFSVYLGQRLLGNCTVTSQRCTVP